MSHACPIAHETRLSMTLSDDGSLQAARGPAPTSARAATASGCIAILGLEGERRDVDSRRARGARILRAAGGMALGAGPGKAWLRGRFAGPYLRDALLDRGVMGETLETAAPWSGLMDLYAAVGDALPVALEGRGTPGLVMCHISHLYPDGASLYYTFIAPQQEGEELEQWWAVKSAACDAIVASGGTITHHHAIGRDHAPWMPQEIGAHGHRRDRRREEEGRPGGDPEPREGLAVRVPETNMHEALGIEMTESGDGVVTGKLPVVDEVRQPFGLVHGGALLTLAESLTSFGTWMGVRDNGEIALGQEINASLLRPITEGHVHGTATRPPPRPHRLGVGGRDHRRPRPPLRPDPRHDRGARRPKNRTLGVRGRQPGSGS